MLGIKEDVSLFLPDDIREILKDLGQKSRARVYRVKKINENYFGEDIYLSPEFNSVRIYVDDITERKLAEEALKRAHNELENRVTERTSELIKLYEELENEKHQINIINRLLQLFVENTSRKEFLDDAVKIIQEWCDCRCLGIRILDEKGNIPYESSIGFSKEFLESESLLSVNTDHCACIRVITEKPEPQDMPVMTQYGSFYSNNTFEFVDGLNEAEKSRFRGVCVRSGFRSVAVIPIFYHDKALGAIHLADEKEGMVQIDKVKFIETLSPLIGEAIYKFNAEEELRNSREQLRNLTAHLQAVREEERTTIAREIHDELGQIMTALKIDLSWLRNNYSDHEALNVKTGSMMSLIDETIMAVRRIITELRPGILDHLGISAAMEWQAEEFKKLVGIPCDIVIKPEEIILNKELSINIFRIFQEILTNVMRHAEATHVNVFLEKSDGKILLRVVDNGKGITEEEMLKPASVGIMGISERVNYMGGRLNIDGIPQKGTTIVVVVPIDGKPQQ